jgi:hypothetical protein
MKVAFLAAEGMKVAFMSFRFRRFRKVAFLNLGARDQLSKSEDAFTMVSASTTREPPNPR